MGHVHPPAPRDRPCTQPPARAPRPRPPAARRARSTSTGRRAAPAGRPRAPSSPAAPHQAPTTRTASPPKASSAAPSATAGTSSSAVQPPSHQPTDSHTGRRDEELRHHVRRRPGALLVEAGRAGRDVGPGEDGGPADLVDADVHPVVWAVARCCPYSAYVPASRRSTTCSACVIPAQTPAPTATTSSSAAAAAGQRHDRHEPRGQHGHDRRHQQDDGGGHRHPHPERDERHGQRGHQQHPDREPGPGPGHRRREHRQPRLSGSHQARLSRYHATVSARPCVERHLRRVAQLGGDLGRVDASSGGRGPCGPSTGSTRGPVRADGREQPVGQLAVGQLGAAADVVDLAGAAAVSAPAAMPRQWSSTCSQSRTLSPSP